MVHDGPNTWLVEPKWLPSNVIEFQPASFGSSGDARPVFFQLWNESQKEPEIRSIANCGGAGGVSRVKMNANNGALDTLRPQQGPCAKIS